MAKSVIDGKMAKGVKADFPVCSTWNSRCTSWDPRRSRQFEIEFFVNLNHETQSMVYYPFV